MREWLIGGFCLAHALGLSSGRAVAQQSTFANQAVQALTAPRTVRGEGKETLPDTTVQLLVPPPDFVSPPSHSGNSPEEVGGDFPPLPPPPDGSSDGDPLPPLSEELWRHGGSYLYQPEGDRLNWPNDGQQTHYDLLRLPETWQKPKPMTAFSEFLGADPIRPHSHPGCLFSSEYSWDRRFVAYGGYELFGFALQQAGQRQDAIGHQLLVDLDLRLTGTERFHVQFRPLGPRTTGGSYYQFSDPEGYQDNSIGEPERYWFEGEVHSLLGPSRDPLASAYANFVVGKFPFLLHNSQLMNDEILGFVLSKNNLYLGGLSNLNIQLWAGVDDVDTYPNTQSEAYGINAFADYRRVFYEMTYAFVNSSQDRDTHYAGFSGTKFYGPLTLASRALFKFGDQGGTGSAQLFTLESNVARVFEHEHCGIRQGVFFCNAFWASEGWNSIGGGNFNRLRTAFVVDPLVQLAAGPANNNVLGVALGVQLFRHHEDESLIPEIAWEIPGGQSVFGFGLRYLRKTGPRTFLELLGVVNESDDSDFDRDGVFVSHSWIF